MPKSGVRIDLSDPIVKVSFGEGSPETLLTFTGRLKDGDTYQVLGEKFVEQFEVEVRPETAPEELGQIIYKVDPEGSRIRPIIIGDVKLVVDRQAFDRLTKMAAVQQLDAKITLYSDDWDVSDNQPKRPWQVQNSRNEAQKVYLDGFNFEFMPKRASAAGTNPVMA